MSISTYSLAFNNKSLLLNSKEMKWDKETVEFNNFYAKNSNIAAGSPLPGNYPTQLTFLPKVPGTCTNGENVYFYMLSANDYPFGVQLTYGLYKGDKDGWTADAQANAGGAWGYQTGNDWPTGNSRAHRSYSAIPGTDLSASVLRTCLKWDDSYDGIWVDWLHDSFWYEPFDFMMASCDTAENSAFAVTDKNTMNDLFNQRSASGNNGTYDNVSGQYFFWGTKSFLEE